MTLQKGFEQREQEQAGILEPTGGNDHGRQDENTLLSAFFGPSEEERQKQKDEQNFKRVTSYIMLFTLLVICIVCGVLRHHMGFCLEGLASGVQSQADEACKHPVLEVFFRDHMEKWLKNNGTALGYMSTMLCLPIMLCMGISFYFAHELMLQGWPV